MNIDLLMSIKEKILEEPKRLNMSVWYCKRDTVLSLWDVYGKAEPPCGTVACIAGWALLLKGEDVNRGNVAVRAMDALDIRGYADQLFMPYSGWPETWRRKLTTYKAGSPEYAQVVAEYIDYFIEQAKERHPFEAIRPRIA